MSLRPCLLVWLGLAVGCAPPKLPAPAMFIPLATAAVETRETQLYDDLITVRLHIPPTPEPRKATVISALGDRSVFLGEGFLVVTYRINWELLKQSETPRAPAENAVGKWVLASPSAAVLGQEYLRSLSTIGHEMIPRIVDYLVTVPEVDPTRIGFAGNSSNGFVALQAVARDRRLAVAVVLGGCGDYHRFLQYSSMGIEGRPLELDPEYDRWLRTQEIVEHPERVLHAAILMANRDGDPVIPISCADRTARVLERAYRRAGAPERFRHVVVRSDEHGLGEQEVEQTLTWLVRWLRPSPGENR
jgi:hypothetical protein